MAQTLKNPPAMRETWFRSLGWEDPLGKGMVTHSSILAPTIRTSEVILVRLLANGHLSMMCVHTNAHTEIFTSVESCKVSFPEPTFISINKMHPFYRKMGEFAPECVRLLNFILYWSTDDEQRCNSFRCAAEGLSHACRPSILSPSSPPPQASI